MTCFLRRRTSSAIPVFSPPSPQSEASAATAWLVAVNKPFYPLYVGWFAGSGALAAGATALSLPFFVALASMKLANPRLLRLGLPLLGLADTIFATKLFGPAGGTELFLFPCLTLALLAPETGEIIAARVLAGVVLGVGLLLHGHYGAPLRVWPAEQLARLRELNLVAVASLSFFLAWIFAARLRPAADRC